MTPFRLLLRNLFYHWRGNLAVLLGVVVGAAVLTGALLVGDSLRGSLRELTLRRLGWVDEALVGGRFIRERVVADLPAKDVSPAILVRGTASAGEDGRPVRQVNVLGVTDAFWKAAGEGADGDFWDSDKSEVVLSKTLADALGAHAGDRVSFRVGKAGDVPAETLLGKRDEKDATAVVAARVRSVLDADAFGGRFNLAPTTEAPRNAFLPLKALQKSLGQDEDRARGREARVNAVFVGGAAPDWQDAFRRRLDLPDWGLTVWDPKSRTDALFRRLDQNHDNELTGPEWRDTVEGQPRPKFAGMIADAVPRPTDALPRDVVEEDYRIREPFLTLESDQLFIEPAVASAALAAAKDVGLRPAPTLVYLVDTLAHGEKEQAPYVVVAALDPAAIAPLGPFLPPDVSELKDDEIVLAEWEGSPIKAKRGDTITLTYYAPEQHGDATLLTHEFKLAGTIPLSSTPDEPGLTPDFPGVTDKVSVRQWDPPPPFDKDQIANRIKINGPDERFWNEYRATPRAFVNLAVGQKLWGTRFGDLTSIRMAPLTPLPAGERGEGESDRLAKAKTAFEAALRSHLDPEQAGLAFQPVKEQSLKASQGSTDFAQLFLGFSFFLIVAALLLVGLLFRLNLDRRAPEFGLLTAVGYRRWTIRLLLLGEGAVLAIVGTILGCLAAVAYAALMVQFLDAFWPDKALQSFLRPHYTALSFLIGGAASVLVSVLTILWAVFALGRVAPTALLAGRTTNEGQAVARKRPKWSWWIALVSLILGLAMVVGGWYVPGGENQAMTFFGAGALLLTACLAGAAAWMGGARHGLVEGGGWWGVARLGVRNAARHRARSLLTAGLLASAVFLIVSVEAFRQQAATGPDKGGPAGGFDLVAESDLPILQDLKSDKGLEEIRDKLEIRWRRKYSGDALQGRLDAAVKTLQAATIVPFRVRSGDDASCLNLYQPRKPRMLGAPVEQLQGRFPFAATDPATQHPWPLLDQDKEPLPAFGDQNSVVWVLGKNLGDVIDVTAADGAPKKVRIAGLFQDSLFQSGLILSEKDFLTLYPAQEGYQYFLIATPHHTDAEVGEVQDVLNTALADRGFEAVPTAKRLQAYLAVENTYLTTFQALGGLGLILGSLGLAVVLLRSVWERRGELALLRALGFRRFTLGWLVLAENGFLLLLGLAAGVVSALAAAAPHLVRQAAATPWPSLAALLAATAAVGLAVGTLAAVGAMRAPLVAALRRE